jgi:hypothetical protein
VSLTGQDDAVLANEGEHLGGIVVAVLLWVLKAILVFAALTLAVSVVLVGGLSLVRRRRARDPQEP